MRTNKANENSTHTHTQKRGMVLGAYKKTTPKTEEIRDQPPTDLMPTQRGITDLERSAPASRASDSAAACTVTAVISFALANAVLPTYSAEIPTAAQMAAADGTRTCASAAQKHEGENALCLQNRHQTRSFSR